jgi:hypothetical protein
MYYGSRSEALRSYISGISGPTSKALRYLSRHLRHYISGIKVLYLMHLRHYNSGIKVLYLQIRVLCAEDCLVVIDEAYADFAG